MLLRITGSFLGGFPEGFCTGGIFASRGLGPGVWDYGVWGFRVRWGSGGSGV